MIKTKRLICQENMVQELGEKIPHRVKQKIVLNSKENKIWGLGAITFLERKGHGDYHCKTPKK